MVISSRYKAEPFYPVDLESEVTERLRITCPCSLSFFFNWTNNSAVEERAQIHSNIDEKVHCLYKRNPFLKTTAKEKPPAGLMVWPAKPANMETITKWQHPPGPSSPDQILQSRCWATSFPRGKSSSLQAIWHIIHRTVGRQLWL